MNARVLMELAEDGHRIEGLQRDLMVRAVEELGTDEDRERLARLDERRGM